jgi:hypothetical protein
VRTGALTTVGLKAVLLVKRRARPFSGRTQRVRRPCPAARACSTAAFIRAGRSHSGTRNVLGDVDAAELRAPGGDVGVWAGQHVGVPDDPTGHLRNEDRRVRTELGEPLCEIGGGASTERAATSSPARTSRSLHWREETLTSAMVRASVGAPERRGRQPRAQRSQPAFTCVCRSTFVRAVASKLPLK